MVLSFSRFIVVFVVVHEFVVGLDDGFFYSLSSFVSGFLCWHAQRAYYGIRVGGECGLRIYFCPFSVFADY